MAKKRRVARQKYMDRLREIDAERRQQLVGKQEYGEQKRLKKRGEIEVIKRKRRDDDDTPLDTVSAAPTDADNAAPALTQHQVEMQRKNLAINESRLKLKQKFDPKNSANSNNESNQKRTAADVAASAVDVRATMHSGGNGPQKMRRVEED